MKREKEYDSFTKKPQSWFIRSVRVLTTNAEEFTQHFKLSNQSKLLTVELKKDIYVEMHHKKQNLVGITMTFTLEMILIRHVDPFVMHRNKCKTMFALTRQLQHEMLYTSTLSYIPSSIFRAGRHVVYLWFWS